MNFGERLKELRNAEGWSIRRFALATGLGMATIVDYEAGRRSPAFENVLKLCRVLRISTEAFKDCEFPYERRPSARTRRSE
jgi:transcriptional regulator with XRE-family HTH domain